MILNRILAATCALAAVAMIVEGILIVLTPGVGL